MFGANKLYGVVGAPSAPLWVHSIFATIQGEGPFTGEPATFIRLGGCNLKCFFCDTDFESVRDLNMVEDVVRRVMVDHPSPSMHGQGPLCVLTGGEPLRQFVAPLIAALLDIDWRVQVETAGTVWPHGLDAIARHERFTIVCSPKTATVHKKIEEHCTHWKYIVREGETDALDGLPIMSTQEQGRELRLYRPPRATDTVWLQPCEAYRANEARSGAMIVDKGASARNMRVAAELAMRHGHRLTLQTHKLIGLP